MLVLSRRCPAGCSCCPDHVVSSVVRAVPIIVVSPAAHVVQIMLSCRLLVLSRRCSAGCLWCADHVIESVAGVVPPGWFIVSPAAHVDDDVGCRRLMLSRSCCQIMLSVGVLHARHRGSSQPLCVGIVLSSRTRTWPSYRAGCFPHAISGIWHMGGNRVPPWTGVGKFNLWVGGSWYVVFFLLGGTCFIVFVGTLPREEGALLVAHVVPFMCPDHVALMSRRWPML